jgi:KDO2-lipid IV(A) lauroyltransferase
MSAPAQTKPRNGFLRHAADKILPPMTWGVSHFFGFVAWHCTRRRDDALRNLAHAFPEKSDEWRLKVARESMNRMCEAFVVPLAVPFMSDNELRRRFTVSDETNVQIERLTREKPCIFQTIHGSLAEALTIFPMLREGLKVATVYRPMDIAWLDALVHRARQSRGMRMVSRKAGLLGLRTAVTDGYNIAMLSDQNTMTSGQLVLCFDRVCSASDLSAILVKRLGLRTCIIRARRTGFLRARFEIIEFPIEGSVGDLTARVNLEVEKLLRADGEECADWFWAHRRWKSKVSGLERSLGYNVNGIPHKSFIPESVRAMGLDAMPKNNPYTLLMPEKPELAKIAAGWMGRLRAGRPDVRWIVVCTGENADLFREGENCERLVTYAPGGREAAFRSIRNEWTETYLSFEPDGASGREAGWCHARTSRGILSLALRGPFTSGDYAKALGDLITYCGWREPQPPTESAKPQ